ncbi:MAG TPA: hypothetical protein VGL91_00950 [Acidobacteriota bacterium]
MTNSRWYVISGVSFLSKIPIELRERIAQEIMGPEKLGGFPTTLPISQAAFRVHLDMQSDF